jgi:hypothetical protein
LSRVTTRKEVGEIIDRLTTKTYLTDKRILEILLKIKGGSPFILKTMIETARTNNK